MPLFYLIAGEQSGDILGARLMHAITARRPDARFAGIGGSAMQDAGLTSLFPMHELALMGLLEVLPRLRQLRARLGQTTADIAARRPDIVVTIDAPGFTHRVLRAIAPLGVRRVHYVAPQVWAWREGRVKHYPGLWDQLLCLLPFEPAFFAGHGLPATFVGHPVLESGAGSGNGAAFRGRNGIAPDARIVTIMPGSRRTEVSRLLPILGETLSRIPERITPVVPVAAPVAEAVRTATASWSVRPVLVTTQEDKHDAFAASSAALTKSGTSTLELALAGVPMIVTYRVNPLTAALVRRVVKVKYAALLNLLAGREVVPELIQGTCNPRQLATALHRLLSDPAAASAQVDGFQGPLATLSPGAGLTPSGAAANAVLACLDSAPPTETAPVDTSPLRAAN